MTTRKLSFRLLKHEIQEPEDALKEEHRLDLIPLVGNPENMIFYAGQIFTGIPSWISFFDEPNQEQVRNFVVGGAGGLLFVRIQESFKSGRRNRSRWMVISFGLGFHALRSEAEETTFGIRVALNVLGERAIRSIDTRRPEDSTIQTRTQNSRTSHIFDFGVDVDRIILQSITGKCADSDFATVVTGKDGLQLNTRASYETIQEKCQQVMDAFQGEEFQEHFPWYGNIVPIRDTSRIQELDIILIESIQQGNFESLHLAPPEIVEYQDIEKFNYSGAGRGSDGYDDLALEDFLEIHEPAVLDIDLLKTQKVRICTNKDDGRFKDKWSVYNCLVYEAERNGILYVLSNGAWYEVSENFVESTNQAINNIPECTAFTFPDYTANDQDEGAYNLRVSLEVEGIYYFDRSLVRFKGESGPIEFCDLFSDQCHVFHVKKRERSATLSHLFNQGYVSGISFLEAQDFRQQIRGNYPNLEALIPVERPNPQNYEIVYALIYTSKKTFPFFSKISLATTHRLLQRLGYRVSLMWIKKR